MIEADKRAVGVRDLWKRWHDARIEWENHAREDIDFYLGNHWTKEETDYLESVNQADVVVD